MTTQSNTLDQGQLVWAIVCIDDKLEISVDSVHNISEGAHEKLRVLRSIHPTRIYSLKVTFIYFTEEQDK